MNKKIRKRNNIAAFVRKLKKRNKKIACLNGSFDIIHPGHIKFLEEAKKKGDILVVLLNSDKSIKMYKGPYRPINNEKIRAEKIASLDCVDYIYLFDEINPKKILAEIKPDIYIQGSDWGKNCIEREVIEKYGGKIHIVKLKSGYSTSDYLKKVKIPGLKPEVKAVFFDRDGTINENKGGYIYKIKDFEFTPYAVKALQKISKTDYKIIIINSQSGIGRGYYTEKDLFKLYRWMKIFFKKEKIRVDKIYYCPHYPDDGCECRKPKIKMLLDAVKDLKISLARSWLIGDEERDILMGLEANVKTIKIGKHLRAKFQPRYYAKNLLEAVNIILKPDNKHKKK